MFDNVAKIKIATISLRFLHFISEQEFFFNWLAASHKNKGILLLKLS